MSSKISHQIKQRIKPDNVFITPLELSKKAIDKKKSEIIFI